MQKLTPTKMFIGVHALGFMVLMLTSTTTPAEAYIIQADRLPSSTHEAAPDTSQQAVQTDLAERTRQLIEQYEEDAGAEQLAPLEPIAVEAPAQQRLLQRQQNAPPPVANVTRTPITAPATLPSAGSQATVLILISVVMAMGVLGGRVLSRL